MDTIVQVEAEIAELKRQLSAKEEQLNELKSHLNQTVSIPCESCKKLTIFLLAGSSRST